MTKIFYPILIYDNLCYSCTRYAKIVNDLTNNHCLIVGHYTELGNKIKRQLFPKDYDGLEMSWFIIDGFANGGRAGLLRLIRYILFDRKKGECQKNEFSLTGCNADCKTVKGLFLRSCRLIIEYKKFGVPRS